MAAFGFRTTAEEAAQALASSIKGRTVLITGVSTGGIGFETARAIALHQPAEIILTGRSAEKLNEAERLITAGAAGVKTRKLQLDLDTQASVRKAAAELNSWPDLPKIDVVINNAGVMALPRTLTQDGVEAHFATNHLGHFLLNALIIGKVLAAGPGARIVTVASAGYRYSEVRFDDINFDNGDYEPLKGYGQSKTANILYATALAPRLQAKGVLAYSLHPGAIKTELTRHIPLAAIVAMGVMDEDGNTVDSDIVTWKTIAEGASTTIVAAFDPSIADQSGAYLEDGHVVTPNETYTQDVEKSEKLWQLSEKLVGQKFEV